MDWGWFDWFGAGWADGSPACCIGDFSDVSPILTFPLEGGRDFWLTRRRQRAAGRGEDDQDGEVFGYGVETVLYVLGYEDG